LAAVRPIDVQHLGVEKVICVWQVDDLLIDPGPESTLETVLAALDGQRPRALLLTHIHFDHAGAAGALVRRWPDLPVYVHERGARHLVDPERLVASASKLYDDFSERWGEVVPLPEENLRVLSGGERDVEGAFRVEYTPGHAVHHVSYLHEPSGWAFVGDMAGVRIPPTDYTVAPTVPPDFDVEAWERSLDTIAAWDPAALALTHFGRVDEVAPQLAAVRESLQALIELADGHDQAGFEAELRRRSEARAAAVTAQLPQAAPPDLLYMGLDRWRRKRAAA
jgi:glyoxylase-like metal-dependent hydrolase (beta-lactamase superfamily II)